MKKNLFFILFFLGIFLNCSNEVLLEKINESNKTIVVDKIIIGQYCPSYYIIVTKDYINFEEIPVNRNFYYTTEINDTLYENKKR